MTMLAKLISCLTLFLLLNTAVTAAAIEEPTEPAEVTKQAEQREATDAAETAEEAAEAEMAEQAKRAASAFKKQFGLDVRKARSTRETDDDAELAKRLFTEAESGNHDAGVTALLYENAYELGMRDATVFSTANDALDKLLENDPSRKFEIGEMRMKLWETWYEEKPDDRSFDPEAYIDLSLRLSQEAVEAGDMALGLKFLNRGNRFASRNDSPRKNDIRDTMTELIQTRKILEEIAALEETLATDALAHDKLAMIYLAKLDDPEKAIEYAPKMSDAELAAEIQLAVKPFEEATPAEAKQTGMFYYGLATENKTGDTIAMLIRSRVWLAEYISRAHEEPEAETVELARETISEIDADLLKRGIGKKLRRKLSSVIRGEGQFGRPPEVQAAIDKGVEWLYSQRKDEQHWEAGNASHRNWGGYTALVVYALLMADEEPRLNGDLSRAVHFMMNTEMKGTYAICFRIHAWEVLPRRERYRQTLVQDVTRLRRGATKHGYWGYTMAGNDVRPGERLDTSTTLAGGLGLWIGEEVGGMTPKKVYWERLARGLLENQLEDKGWSYNPAVMRDGQGAMTAGALALLHASYPHLGEATKAKVKVAIDNGMEWMDQNFSPTKNVNRGGGFKCYYFAAVQHAGLFAGRRDFKDMDWYESIKEHLLTSQSAAGSWGSVEETAFAIAFLCRGGVVYEGSENALKEADQAAAQEATKSADADATEAPTAEQAPAPADAIAE